MQLFAKFKKILRRGFRATLNFQKFKVALNPLHELRHSFNSFPLKFQRFSLPPTNSHLLCFLDVDFEPNLHAHQSLVIFLPSFSYQPVGALVSTDRQHCPSLLGIGSMSTRVPNVYPHMRSSTPNQVPRGIATTKEGIPVSHQS